MSVVIGRPWKLSPAGSLTTHQRVGEDPARVCHAGDRVEEQESSLSACTRLTDAESGTPNTGSLADSAPDHLFTTVRAQGWHFESGFTKGESLIGSW